MSLVKWSPFYEPYLDIDRALESLSENHAFAPAVDVYDKDKNLVVEIALTGIDPKKVSLNIEENVLSIQGSSESKKEVDDKHYYRKEVRSGAFHSNLPSWMEQLSQPG